MHTFRTKNGTRFSYNSDLSGDIIVTPHESRAVFVVRGDDMQEFIKNYLKEAVSRQVDNMNFDDSLEVNERVKL